MNNYKTLFIVIAVCGALLSTFSIKDNITTDKTYSQQITSSNACVALENNLYPIAGIESDFPTGAWYSMAQFTYLYADNKEIYLNEYDVQTKKYYSFLFDIVKITQKEHKEPRRTYEIVGNNKSLDTLCGKGFTDKNNITFIKGDE